MPDAEYQYNSDGIRVAQNIDGVETRFLIDTNQPYAQVVEEYTPNGNVEVLYVYGHDLISQLTDSQDYFYHVDGLGSTRALTNESGLMTDRYIYDAFGQIIEQVGTTENPYLFAGEWRDSETGIDYLRARYLDTATGRFLSRDTFPGMRDNPVTLHRYQYANANPVMFIDPSGYISLNNLVAARQIQDILRNNSLNQTIQLGSRVLETIDTTVSVIDTFWTVFKLASGDIPVLKPSLSLDLSGLPNLDDAVSALRAESGRIFTGVLYKKVPKEIKAFRSYFTDENAQFAIFPPDVIARLLPSKVKTGLKIQDRDVVISSNKQRYRLFGTGIVRKTRRGEGKLQFFRMDYGPYNHRGGRSDDHDIWTHGKFHFHIPRSN